MTGSTIQHVSDTAFMVAYCRALESARADALFNDPLAGQLAGEKGKSMVASFKTQRMTIWMIAMRTSVIDRFILEAVERGVNTVVNIGAGLDTRPYRMDLPRELKWIEIDYPEMIEFKRMRLAGESPRCLLERVGADLADRNQRRSLLLRTGGNGHRILVLAEGVVIYLDPHAVAELADDVRAIPGVESWIVDYFSPEMLAYRRKAGLGSQMSSAPFRFQPDDW